MQWMQMPRGHHCCRDLGLHSTHTRRADRQTVSRLPLVALRAGQIPPVAVGSTSVVAGRGQSLVGGSAMGGFSGVS